MLDAQTSGKNKETIIDKQSLVKNFIFYFAEQERNSIIGVYTNKDRNSYCNEQSGWLDEARVCEEELNEYD